MRFREYPLLNTPNMVAVLLHTAAAGPATLDACTDALFTSLEQADERPPFSREEVAARLAMLARYLGEAGLMAGTPADGYVLTERGRAALAEYPQGLDTADLTQFPDFARFLRALDRRRPVADARAAGYDLGYSAYWSGRAPADNPYSPDSADHLAWENGWSEALDEEFPNNGPRYGTPA